LPTIATEAVLFLAIINAKEERDVTVIDIPNTFIQMQVEVEEDSYGNHQDLWSPFAYPHSDCSQHLQVLHHR
jgi:hypothetical protein